MKENKEILLTFDKKKKYPFSITFTMDFPEDMGPEEQKKEWQEIAELLKHRYLDIKISGK